MSHAEPPQRDAPQVAPYAHAVRAGSLVFVSGQVGRDGRGRLVGGFERQAHRVFANIEAVLATEGARLTDIVKMTGFLARPGDLDQYRAVLDQYFPAGWPAHTLVVASPIDPGELVEIEVIASLGRDD